MAWYPGAQRMELQPESSQQPAIVPSQFILHSIAAPWDERRIYEYWRDSTNLESHFGLDFDGSIGQFLSTATKADANFQANARAVSIETASNLEHTDPWTDAQVEQLIRLGVWLHQAHGIPLRICRAWDDPGFGYHRLFREWSTSGTACPGDARVRQFHDRVFPGIVARATGQTTQEEDMPDDATLRKMIREETLAAITSIEGRDGVAWAVRNYSGDGQASIVDQLGRLPDKYSTAHEVLYWLNQAMSGAPESAGDHPLNSVVPQLAEKFRAIADALAAVPAGATPEQIRAAVAAALAAGIGLTVTAPASTG